MRFGIREGAVSGAVFIAVLLALMSFDPRLRDVLSDAFGSGQVTPWGDRLGDMGSALWTAARDQSLDNAPLLVFATVGTVLTVFMFRS